MKLKILFLAIVLIILLGRTTISTELTFVGDYCIQGQDCILNDLFLTGNFSFVGDLINVTILNQNITGQLSIDGSLNINDNLTVDTDTLLVDSTNDRVGIGTANPEKKLEIVGSGQTIISVNDSSNKISTHLISGTEYGFVGTQSSHDFRMITGGTTKMTIDTSGRVLIGTTSSVDVNGAELFMQLVSTTNNAAGALFMGLGTANSDTGYLTLGKDRATTYGGHTAVVDGNRLGSIDFDGSDGTNYKAFARIEGYVDGDVGSEDAPGRLRFLTTPDGDGSPDERMRITNQGLIGINTTSPAQTLTVQGTLNVTADGTEGPNLFVASDGNVGIGTTAPNDALEVVGNVRVSGSLNASLINATILRVNNTLFVNGSRVGIGTASPSEHLTIKVTKDGTGISVTESDSTTEAVGIAGYATSGYINLNSGGSTTISFDASSGGLSIFNTGGGKVGIETASPYNTLTVVGSVGVSGSLNASSINTTGNAYFAVNSGNVGIGTSAPEKTLHVRGGNILMDNDQWFMVDGVGGTASNVFKIDTGNDLLVRVTSNNDINFQDSTTTNLFIDGYSGNVGIGTTAPISPLDVDGNVTIRGNLTVLGENATFKQDVTIDGTLNGGSPVKIAGINITKNTFSLEEDRNQSSRFTLRNLNDNSNASAVISAINNIGASMSIGILSTTYKLDTIDYANATALISRSRGKMLFVNSYNEDFFWLINPSDDNDLANLVEVMNLNASGLTIQNNLTVLERLILPSIVQLSPSQSTFLVRDDTSGVVGTKFGITNPTASSDADSGVSYILATDGTKNNNNMSLDLHSSLDPNNPLTVVSHYSNDVRGHVWRLNPSNENAFFRWEVGKAKPVMIVNKTGEITFNNSVTIDKDGSLIVIGNATFNDAWTADSSRLGAKNIARPQLLNEVATSTNPNIVMAGGDDDTGFGRQGANTLSIITGGVSRIFIDATGNVSLGRLNISGKTVSGALGYCGMDDTFTWSCSAG